MKFNNHELLWATKMNNILEEEKIGEEVEVCAELSHPPSLNTLDL